MADPLISLAAEQTPVSPGEQVRVGVTVTNNGAVVEGYWLQVLGPAAAWAEVVPAEISVYPQQSVTAEVVFSPPADSSVLSGQLPYGVLASSMLDANSAAAAEADLEIGELHSLQAKITPVTSTGRWHGRHVVQLTNWGNSPARLQLVAADPDQALGFYLKPALVDLPPGGQVAVRVSARARRPFLRGTPVRVPFQVIGEPATGNTKPINPYGDPSRPVIDGAFNQRQIMSGGFVTMLVLLLLAVAGLVAFILLRPTPPAEPLAERGSPAKPVLRVVGVTDTSVTLGWTKVELADGYHLLQTSPDGKSTLNDQLLGPIVDASVISGLPPETKVCYRLVASRAGQTGPPSDLTCVTTLSPQPTASPTPTPTPTPTPSVSTSTPSPTPTATATDSPTPVPSSS